MHLYLKVMKSIYFIDYFYKQFSEPFHFLEGVFWWKKNVHHYSFVAALEKGLTMLRVSIWLFRVIETAHELRSAMVQCLSWREGGNEENKKHKEMNKFHFINYKTWINLWINISFERKNLTKLVICQ